MSISLMDIVILVLFEYDEPKNSNIMGLNSLLLFFLIAYAHFFYRTYNDAYIIYIFIIYPSRCFSAFILLVLKILYNFICSLVYCNYI